MEIRYRYIRVPDDPVPNAENYPYSEDLLLNYRRSDHPENDVEINPDFQPEELIKKELYRKKGTDKPAKGTSSTLGSLNTSSLSNTPRRPEHRELPPVGAAHLLLPWEKSGLKNPNSNRPPVYRIPSAGKERSVLPKQPPIQPAEWNSSRRTDEGGTARRIAEINQELDNLIGLEKVKKLVKEIQAFVEIQHKRAREQLVTDPLVLHMIFSGNPGTGKTTVARLIGRLFKEMGVLQKGHLVEVERADLVGEYIGHTAQKTRDQVKRALGGILFIDEAYSLARGGERDFGKESIDALVKSMEDYKDNLILILAGYREEMDLFVRSNPGIRSRFPLHISFPDYSVEELMQIANLMLSQREYCFSAEARAELQRILEQQIREGMGHNGNARLVRNLIERGIRRQAVRVVTQKVITREDLILIRHQDITDARGII
jgi:stage V sporulation protein K